MKKISKEHILLLHQILIQHTGGLDGIRDEGLLESAIPYVQLDVRDADKPMEGRGMYSLVSCWVMRESTL